MRRALFVLLLASSGCPTEKPAAYEWVGLYVISYTGDGPAGVARLELPSGAFEAADFMGVGCGGASVLVVVSIDDDEDGDGARVQMLGHDGQPWCSGPPRDVGQQDLEIYQDAGDYRIRNAPDSMIVMDGYAYTAFGVRR